MGKCIIPSCGNRTDSFGWKKRKKRPVKVSFFRFPKHEQSRKIWADILEVDFNKITDHTRVCSLHFKEENIDKSGTSCRLLPNSLPKTRQEIIELSSDEYSCEDTCSSISSSNVEPMAVQMDDTNFSSMSEGRRDQAVQTSPIHVPKEDKSTMVSEFLIYHSPEKERLRKRIAYLEEEHRKKMKAANQTIRRLKEKIDSCT